MAVQSVRVPKYRHHKGSGQPFVQVKGRRHYLSKHGSDENWERYRRLVAELLARPAVPTAAPAEPAEEIRVVELAAA